MNMRGQYCIFFSNFYRFRVFADCQNAFVPYRHERIFCKGFRTTGRAERRRGRTGMERNRTVDQIRRRRARGHGQMGPSARGFVEFPFAVERQTVSGVGYV